MVFPPKAYIRPPGLSRTPSIPLLSHAPPLSAPPPPPLPVPPSSDVLPPVPPVPQTGPVSVPPQEPTPASSRAKSVVPQSQSQALTTATAEGGSIIESPERTMWLKRIQLFSEAIQTQKEVKELSVQLQHHAHWRQRNSDVRRPDEGEVRIKTDLAKVEEKYTQKRKEFSAILTFLEESGSWSLLSEQSGVIGDVAQHEGQEELKSYISELKATVTDLHVVLQEIASRAPAQIRAPSLPGPSTSALYQDDIEMELEIDSRPENPRPKKRQRIASGNNDFSPDSRSAVSDAEDEADEEDEVVDPMELNEIRDRLEKVEGQVADVDNRLTQYQHDIEKEFEDRMDQKLIELKNTFATVAESQRSEADRVVEDLKEMMAGLEGSLDVNGDQIFQLANEVASVIPLEHENERLKQENEMLKKRISKMEERQTKELDNMKLEMEALNTTVTTCVSQPPQGIMLPSGQPINSVQDIADALTPTLVDLVRSEMQPILLSLKDEIQKLLLDKNSELITTVFAKFSVMVQWMEQWSAWANRMGVDPGHGAHAPSRGPSGNAH